MNQQVQYLFDSNDLTVLLLVNIFETITKMFKSVFGL